MDNLFGEIVFWALAVVTVGSALLVVIIRDVFRAALLLATTFMGIAGLFVMLNAEFLAVVQILVAQGLPTCIAHARVSHHTRKPQATPTCTALVACARFNRWE